MSEVRRISSNAPWEPIVGYSRAVKAGEWVLVSGTTATDHSGSIVGIGQMYVQARQAIANIERALKQAGLDLKDVVRTRIFATDLSRFDDIARAHREAFGAAAPAATAVEVRRLVHPDMLIEIEALAYASAPEADSESPSRTTPRATAAKKEPTRPTLRTAAKRRTQARTRGN